MAGQAFQVSVSAHAAEFSERARKLTIYFNIPSAGINENTGILLVVHSLGEEPNSSFYQLLRSDWADRYNVVSVGLTYMGSKTELGGNSFHVPSDQTEKLLRLVPAELLPQCVRDNGTLDLGKVIELLPNRDLSDYVYCVVTGIDFEQDYNDFGYIQAIDCITALNAIIAIAEDNGHHLCLGRVFAFGIGHGGYVAMMADKFAPSTFALVADNSGWIYPELHRLYADTKEKEFPNGLIISQRKPAAYDLEPGKDHSFTQDMFEIRSLNNFGHRKQMQPLHKGRYILLHGELDKTVFPAEKRKFADLLESLGFSVELHLFGPLDIDGVMLHHVTHGLPGNWKALFERYCDPYCLECGDQSLVLSGDNELTRKDKIIYGTSNGRYVIDYSYLAPVIYYEPWQEAKRVGKV